MDEHILPTAILTDEAKSPSGGIHFDGADAFCATAPTSPARKVDIMGPARALRENYGHQAESHGRRSLPLVMAKIVQPIQVTTKRLGRKTVVMNLWFDSKFDTTLLC